MMNANFYSGIIGGRGALILFLTAFWVSCSSDEVKKDALEQLPLPKEETPAVQPANAFPTLEDIGYPAQQLADAREEMLEKADSAEQILSRCVKQYERRTDIKRIAPTFLKDGRVAFLLSLNEKRTGRERKQLPEKLEGIPVIILSPDVPSPETCWISIKK